MLHQKLTLKQKNDTRSKEGPFIIGINPSITCKYYKHVCANIYTKIHEAKTDRDEGRN